MNTEAGVLHAEVRGRLQRLAGLMVLIVAVGTLGQIRIEGWTTVDTLYMTVITLSTVGFGEVRPLAATGQLHTTLLIIAGVGAAAFLVSTITRYVVSGELRGTLRKGRMQHRINRMSGHYDASHLSGSTLVDSNIHGETGATVLAIRRRPGGPIITNPGPNMRFETGDRLIALGTRHQFKKLTELARA